MSGVAEEFISLNTVREMDTWIFAGVIVLIIVAAILAYLNYCGLFHGVEISTGAPFIQNVTFAYKFAMGPYENSGFIFCEASKLAPKAKALGIYYDNPDKVSAANMRYAAGAILSEGPKDKIDPDIRKAMEAAGFKVMELPEMKNCVRTTFPFLNKISLFFAYTRVYPKLMRYVEEHKLDVKVMLEVYENNMIQFMSPQDHQDDFFVPEATEAELAEHRNQ